MKKILIILLFSFILYGCGENKHQKEIEKIMSENNYVIIDVRTKEEYDELHVEDAINIPYDEINEEINIVKDTIIFVYCKSGNRSKIAFDKLSGYGYIVYDLGALDKIELKKE